MRNSIATLHEASDGGATCESPADLEAPAISGLLDAVVYDWDMTTDVIVWGANARDVLKEFPEDWLRTGAAFAQAEALGAGAARSSFFVSGAPGNDDAGSPYELAFALHAPTGAHFHADDIGRWWGDAAGRPLRAHGMLRLRKTVREDASQAPFAPLRLGRLSREQLISAIEVKAQVSKSQLDRFAVVAIGVDHLDSFNATFGYAAGDELLQSISEKLLTVLRSTDCFARHAGSSFIALLALSRKDNAAATASRLAERLNQGTFTVGDAPTKAVVRVGLALGAPNGRPADSLIRRAMDSLEHARTRGTLSACFDDSEAKRMRLRQEADDLASLDRAIAAGAFALAYQPIMPLSSQLPLLHEGLARFLIDDGTVAKPLAWMGLAERHGRIAAIDSLMVQAAITTLTARPELSIAVNVSPLTLRDTAFTALIRGALFSRPQIASRLIVEIVETAAILDVNAIVENFADLRAAGVRLAMDDFGAGHTSLRNLRALKADIVKIDGAFVQNIVRSSDDRFFVRELIALARRIGAKIVAEWVEDGETLSLLRRWGCDYAQGNYVGAPSFDIAREPLEAMASAV
jgi:diguanylate cyclase (GGDEF)-like protein